MADTLTAEKRSWNMSRIRGKDTAIEKRVRSFLFSLGYRFRKNDPRLPGKPDIVLPKYRTVVFIHGCFWHRHPACKDATLPKTRTEFWQDKFAKNVANDIKHTEELKKMGYHVIVLWECEINKYFEITMEKLLNDIGGK